jgi:hypothetical protein
MKTTLWATWLAILCGSPLAAVAAERGDFVAQHDLTVIAPPVVEVDAAGATITRIIGMVGFTGDIVCTGISEVTIIAHPSGRQEISGEATFPMPGTPGPCTFGGQPFAGSARSHAGGDGVRFDGHFTITGTVGEGTLHGAGLFDTDFTRSPPVHMSGAYVVTP